MSRRQAGSASRSGGVRVLAGRWRGRRLAVPAGVRPTQARVREALFSHWGDQVEGRRLLDLYAGSGAVSFEALSRGAGHALAIDRSLRALGCLRVNRRRFGTDCLRAFRAELPRNLHRATASEDAFDLVFIDPPYDAGGLCELLTAVAALVAAGGEVVLEHSSRRLPPEAEGRLRRRMTRRYGDSALTVYR